MVRQYDIVMADLPRMDGSRVIQGAHPVVVLSNNRCNATSPVLVVVPLTSKLKRLDLASHVILHASGLRDDGMALAEQVTAIDRSLIMYHLGVVDRADERKALVRAIAGHLGFQAAK